MRAERKDIEAISTARYVRTLHNGQFFCETLKAWEIWQEQPLTRLKRFSKQAVLWVIPRKAEKGK